FLKKTTTVKPSKKRKKETEIPKRLTIDVPECEYWYAPAKVTVCGIDEDGKLQYVHAGNESVRDDRLKLAAVLAFALAWYGKDRQAVEIPIKQVGKFIGIGSVLKDIE